MMARAATSPETSKFPSQAKWRENNRQKVWAQAALRSALKRGLLSQQPCCVCGSSASEAHHPNYDMPMAVDWYCRLHHKAEHARMKAEAVKKGGGE